MQKGTSKDRFRAKNHTQSSAVKKSKKNENYFFANKLVLAGPAITVHWQTVYWQYCLPVESTTFFTLGECNEQKRLFHRIPHVTFLRLHAFSTAHQRQPRGWATTSVCLY
jgi:hypothetical protein